MSDGIRRVADIRQTLGLDGMYSLPQFTALYRHPISDWSARTIAEAGNDDPLHESHRNGGRG